MKTYCLNTEVSSASMKKIIDDIYNKKYVTIAGCNVNTVVRSYYDENLNKIINSFDYRIPDGYPLTWPLNISSKKKYKRLAGADIFDYFVENDTELRHFFLGDTDEVLKLMKKNLIKKNEKFQISGVYSPPFAPIDDWNLEEITMLILNSKTDMLWVGLGFPKQEIFINKIRNSLPEISIYGAGAIFQWTAELNKRAPVKWQEAGFEWLWRLINDPKRLWRRYLVDNTLFIFLFFKQYLRKSKFNKPLKT
tara:strand:+ start:224 stop:973 length:750 start_codon:yes stop_codon:yes gene_type:complete